MTNPTDTAHILACLRDEPNRLDEVFAKVFLQFKRPVYVLCLRIIGHAEDAEDAMQETFVAAHRGLARFRGESSLQTWLYRIAIRHAYRVQAKRKKPRVEYASAVMSTNATPEDNVEVAQRFERAFDALSAEHRTVLVLFGFKGLTHREIADILGIPEGTVWSRLHAARKRLQSLL